MLKQSLWSWLSWCSYESCWNNSLPSIDGWHEEAQQAVNVLTDFRSGFDHLSEWFEREEPQDIQDLTLLVIWHCFPCMSQPGLWHDQCLILPLALVHMQPYKELSTAKFTSSSCSKWRATMTRDLDANSTKQSGQRRLKLKFKRVLNVS